MTYVAAHLSRAIFERFLHVGARSLEWGCEPADDGSQQRCDRGETQRGITQVHLTARGELDRAEREKNPEAPLRDQQTDRAAEDREHEALSEQLTHNAAPRCAERRADGDFALPRGAARKQKVGYVGARTD